MMKFNQDMAKAGILIALDGLQASSKGARVTFQDGKTTVSDGPFAETKELIAGYWIIDVKSKEEAVAWARCAPFLTGPDEEAVIEVRQVFDMADFPHDVVDQEVVDRVCQSLSNR